MSLKKLKVALICCICLALMIIQPMLVFTAYASVPDEPEMELSQDPSIVGIDPADEIPDPNADDAPEVVIVDEDVPLGDDVDQDNVANVWLIVVISVGAVAVLAVVVAIIVSKARAKK